VDAYPVRQISLGAKAPTRQIAFVCRGSDVDNRRVGALRSAFQSNYQASADEPEAGA
jgi:hypothetical protein